MEEIRSLVERPREKLEEKGIQALSDKELVMLLISKGTQNHPIDEVAENVLKVLDKGSGCSLNAL